MKASLKWLKEFVDFSLSAGKLSHLLTMAGLEIEESEEVDGDTIFEVAITPNRPDCLSIRGIAREISANLELPLKERPVSVKTGKGTPPDIVIEDSDLCPRYASRLIYGVKPGPSPERT